MSEATDDFEVTVEFTFTQSDGDEVTIRQPMLGMSPYILVQPEFDEHHVTFQGIACDFDKEELANVLRILADAVEEGTIEETVVVDDSTD